MLHRFILLSAACAVAAPVMAQVHDHKHTTEELGTVEFAMTCEAKAKPAFDRGLALLHSFGYEESRTAFQEAAQADAACGIAHWGVAMTYYHPIWAPPNEKEFAAGRAAAETAARVGAKSDRERRYISAIGALLRPRRQGPAIEGDGLPDGRRAARAGLPG